MIASPHPISPLRQRMIEDMRMRKLGDKTQAGYVRAVRYFAKYLGRSPDTATVEDLRNYQLYLVDHGTSPMSLNAAICGLKFFFTVTLDRPGLMTKMQPVHLPRKLPVILSPDEVKRLIAAAGNLKHQTALALAYATDLRISEVVSLKVTDIDSQRMTLRVEQGKGHKDRLLFSRPTTASARAFPAPSVAGCCSRPYRPHSPPPARVIVEPITAVGVDLYVADGSMRQSSVISGTTAGVQSP